MVKYTCVQYEENDDFTVLMVDMATIPCSPCKAIFKIWFPEGIFHLSVAVFNSLQWPFNSWYGHTTLSWETSKSTLRQGKETLGACSLKSDCYFSEADRRWGWDYLEIMWPFLFQMFMPFFTATASLSFQCVLLSLEIISSPLFYISEDQ